MSLYALHGKKSRKTKDQKLKERDKVKGVGLESGLLNLCS